MRYFWMIFAPLILAACATVTDAPETVAFKPNALSARTLAPGECGLFVWTADADKRFILFSQSQKNSGVWKGRNGETDLVITVKDGPPSNRQYPVQQFDEAGLKLALKETEVIMQGTRYNGGTLTELSPEGWDKVTPVVGLSMCQTG